MFDVPRETPEDLPFVKEEDYQYFAKLLDDKAESELSADEVSGPPPCAAVGGGRPVRRRRSCRAAHLWVACR
jgi:hypothetical protein